MLKVGCSLDSDFQPLKLDSDNPPSFKELNQILLEEFSLSNDSSLAIKYFDNDFDKEIKVTNDKHVRNMIEYFQEQSSIKDRVIKLSIVKQKEEEMHRKEVITDTIVNDLAQHNFTLQLSFPSITNDLTSDNNQNDDFSNISSYGSFAPSFLDSFSDTTSQKQDQTIDILNQRYSSIEFIDKGAFGAVYKVMNKEASTVRAIKLIQSENIQLLNDSLKEAFVILKIGHENVVHLYDVFFTTAKKDTLCYEMEYCPLKSLHHTFIVKKEQCSEFYILKILQQTAKALEYLYFIHNFVHRDIKPQNILVRELLQNENIEVALADFGLTRTLESKAHPMAGTLFYLSPEILLQQNNAVSHASDIFALGVTIYQLITLDTSTNISTLCCYSSIEEFQDKIRNNLKNCNVSNYLTELILLMLHKESEQRPTAKQILNILKGYYKDSKVLIKESTPFSNDFNFIKSFGSYGSEINQFNTPYDIKVDATRDLIFIADNENRRVSVFNYTTNEFLYLIDIPTGYYPRGLAFDPSDEEVILITCGDNATQNFGHCILRFNKDGKQLIRQYGKGPCGDTADYFDRPTGLTVDPADGTIYVCDTANNRIQVYSKEGVLLRSLGTYGKKKGGTFDRPYMIDINLDGNLVIADWENHRIQVIDKITGKFISAFGKSGHGNGEFRNPEGIAIDKSNGNILISDTDNHRIQVFDKDFKFIKSYGKYGTEEGKLHCPRGIDLCKVNGWLFVIDSTNNRIQYFK